MRQKVLVFYMKHVRGTKESEKQLMVSLNKVYVVMSYLKDTASIGDRRAGFIIRYGVVTKKLVEVIRIYPAGRYDRFCSLASYLLFETR